MTNVPMPDIGSESIRRCSPMQNRALTADPGNCETEQYLLLHATGSWFAVL